MNYALLIACIECLVMADDFPSNETSEIYVAEKQLKQLLIDAEEYLTCAAAKPTYYGQVPKLYLDCHELYLDDYTDDGVYRIWLVHGYRFVSVYCDMQTVGSLSGKRGWITIQRRIDGKVNFNRNWKEYVDGFGAPDGEYWIGLYTLYNLLRQKKIGGRNAPKRNLDTAMRFDLEDWDGVTAFAESSSIEIMAEKGDFKVINVGRVTETLGLQNPITALNQTKFSTYDRNDESQNPGKNQRGGWWCKSGCTHSNLNGIFTKRRRWMSNELIFVGSWKNVNPENAALRYVSMKLQ